MRDLPFGAKLWLLCLLLSLVLVPFSFWHLDLQVAAFARRHTPNIDGLGEKLGSAVLLTVEAVILLCVAFYRVWFGHISRFGKTMALASLTSVCAYAINSSVLKVIFGIPTPYEVLEGTHHGLNLMAGSLNSSFPSGHMTLAGAFAGVFFRLYPASRLLFSLGLLLAAVLLIAGGWHFVSDVLAGAFLGVTAGLLAGEVWHEHVNQLKGIAAKAKD